MGCPGGVDATGCPMPDTCMGVDPYAKGNTFCPANCKDEEMFCSGGVDEQTGWPKEDFCIPINQDCPTFCPVNCGQDDTQCSGGVDAKGCPREDSCMPWDPYCPAKCPANCNEDE